MQESVITLVVIGIIVTGFVVLGVAWLIYLGNGGRPVHVAFRGLGIKVDIGRPTDDGADAGDNDQS